MNAAILSRLLRSLSCGAGLRRGLVFGLVGLAAATTLVPTAIAESVPAAPAAPAAAGPESCSDAKDCYNKGARANQAKDYLRAAKFLASGCDFEPKACNVVGEIYRIGLGGVAKDGGKAAGFHQKACDKGIVLSCAVEAQLRYHGQEGAAVDKARARTAFERSCNPEFLDSCVNAGVMYSTGDGGAADKSKARALFQKACDSSEQTACVNAATMYLAGEGGDADKQYALQLFEAACEKKNFLGCYNAGLVYEKGVDTDKDLTKAVSLLQRACEGGHKLGCTVAQQVRDNQAIEEQNKAAAAAAAAKAKAKKR